jgi:ferric-chelate reductase
MLARKLIAPGLEEPITTPVILSGPYGENITESLASDVNILCIAGGTGISFVLPVLLDLIRQDLKPTRGIKLVWAIRRKSDVEWVKAEMVQLRNSKLGINVFVTAESQEDDHSGNLAEKKATERGSAAEDMVSISTEQSFQVGRPCIQDTVSSFTSEVVRGPTIVFASGPLGMINDSRSAVARCNSGSKVWRGDDRFDVSLVCDDRLEW